MKKELRRNWLPRTTTWVTHDEEQTKGIERNNEGRTRKEKIEVKNEGGMKHIPRTTAQRTNDEGNDNEEGCGHPSRTTAYRTNYEESDELRMEGERGVSPAQRRREPITKRVAMNNNNKKWQVRVKGEGGVSLAQRRRNQ